MGKNIHTFYNGELFSGPGGLGLGAEEATATNSTDKWQIRPAWANDFDNDTVKTYRTNILKPFGLDPQIIQGGDVKKFPLTKDNGEPNLHPIDLLSFGFPCNDFSTVGKQKGLKGVYGGLFQYGVKALKAYHPKAFVAENVSGLSSSNGGKALTLILNSFANCGYHLTPNLYKFEQYGVPQTRHRIIIVGIRNDLYNQGVHFQVPAPTTPNPKDYVTCKEAIENPPIKKDAYNNEIPRTTKRVQERLSYIPEGGNAWSPEVPQRLRLNVKGARMSNIYRRLDHTRPAYTVTASGGGGTHMYHWSKNRALTNRERARIQTFPDWFKFIGSQESVRKQIGMAVPVKGAKIVMTALLKTFAGVKYNSVEPTKRLSPVHWRETQQDKQLSIFN